MTYYKIVQDGTVIDAGFVFLKWNEKHHCMFCCDVNEAQFIQSYDQAAVYQVEWLNAAPASAGQFDTVDAVVISETEFDEIRALLDDGETVIDEPEQPIEQPPDEPEQQGSEEPAERPMTVAEMRQVISEQQEQIAMLTDCILEMSEVVYGE